MAYNTIISIKAINLGSSTFSSSSTSYYILLSKQDAGVTNGNLGDLVLKTYYSNPGAHYMSRGSTVVVTNNN